MSPLAHRGDAALKADPGRVIGQLFLPGEERPQERSRAGAVVARVLAVPETEVQARAAQLLRDFSARHRNYAAMLAEHAATVRSHLQHAPEPTAERALLLGASFTAEF